MSAAVEKARARPRVGRLGALSATQKACLAIIVLAALVAIFGPMLAPYDPDASQLQNTFVGPGSEHLLGFDGQGRDLLSRLLVGARTSLLGPLFVVAVTMTAAVGLSILSAWRGGWIDSASAAVLDVLFAFPAILLAILAVAVFGAGLVSASLALSIAYIPFVARVLRSAAVRERERPYVAALEVQGLSGWAICARHLIPNVLPMIIAQGTILFGYAMVDLAAISFLGLGVQPPGSDWGVMVAEGQSGVMQGYPLESLAAGFCIVVVVIAFNLLGESLAGDGARGRTR